MARSLLTAAAVVTTVLLPALPLPAQAYRDGLVLPAAQLYERMLAYAAERDFEKLERSLVVAKPVTDALKTRFGTDTEAEIRDGLGKKDAAQVTRGLRKLIALDMKDLMALGMASRSAEEAATRFRKAYSNYLLLSPLVEARDFPADQRVRNTFRRSVLPSTPEQLQAAADEIDREVQKALEEKPPKR